MLRSVKGHSHPIQKLAAAAEKGVHFLERGIAVAGTMKAAWDGAKAVATFAGPLLAAV